MTPPPPAALRAREAAGPHPHAGEAATASAPLPLGELLVLFPTGVTVVTARDEAGADHGMTVGAFVPVSVDPPLILVCVGVGGRMHGLLRDAEHFGVNVLGADAEETARRFAARGADRFRGLQVARGAGGVALLPGAVAHLECRMRARHWGGDHSIFVGEVVAGHRHPGEPLLYMARAFGRAELRPRGAPPPAARERPRLLRIAEP